MPLSPFGFPPLLTDGHKDDDRRKKTKYANTSKDQKHTLAFDSVVLDRWMSQIVLIVALIISVAIVAYAATVLLNTVHSITSLSKDRYIEVQLSNAERTYP